MRNVVERAGLVPRGTDVWGTSPTRSHEVLVMREAVQEAVRFARRLAK